MLEHILMFSFFWCSVASSDSALSTEMSQTQARQRVSVASGSALSSSAPVTRGASAFSFLSNGEMNFLFAASNP